MSKEHAYAYEAGYRDGSIHYELEHCPACKNVADLQEALAENAKLREQLAKARDPQRIGGTADPESFVYAIEQLREFRWQHATNDEEAIPYINNVADAHERENAKLREEVVDLRKSSQTYESENAELRELVRDVYTLHWNGLDCTECPWFDECDMTGGCPWLSIFADRMRELGVDA